MINWLKENLNNRLEKIKAKYEIANKINDTSTVIGIKFIKRELEEILADINHYEEAEWKYKSLVMQIKKELGQYELSIEQINVLAKFLLEQNLTINECKSFLDIIYNPLPIEQQKKED